VADDPGAVAARACDRCQSAAGFTSAGKNGELSVIDVATGENVSSCEIAKGVDEIAYDPTADRVYCACRFGGVDLPADRRWHHPRGGRRGVGGRQVADGGSEYADRVVRISTDQASFLQELVPGSPGPADGAVYAATPTPPTAAPPAPLGPALTPDALARQHRDED